MRRAWILTIIAFCLLSAPAHGATGDVLFSCDFGTTGDGHSTVTAVWQANGGGATHSYWSSGGSGVLESTGCVTGECAKLTNTTNGQYMDRPINATLSSAYNAVTVVYWTKIDNFSALSGHNIKTFRDYHGTGSGCYMAAMIIGHFGWDWYHSTWTGDATFDPTSAVTSINQNSAYCDVDNGDGTYECGERLEFSWSPGWDNQWHKIRIYIKYPTSTATSDGEIKVWFDEDHIYTLTGIDAEANTGCNETGMESFRFFPSDYVSSGAPYTHWLDDVVVYEGYVPPGVTGSIQATITGGGGNGRWRVANQNPEDNWHVSGYTKSGLAVDTYTVEYLSVFGWDTPASDVVSVTDGGTATPSGTYTAQYGSIQVNISSYNPAGAAWSIDGGTNWNNSGVTLSNLPVYDSPYTITFQTVAGYTKPNDITGVTLTGGGTEVYAVSYTNPVGSLSVTILPLEAANSGAKWRRTGTSTWYDSEDTETGVPAGSVDIEFNDLTGWTKPSNVTGQTITAGQTTSVTTGTTYTRHVGSLTVTISPAGAVSAGAQWRRLGEATWRNSAATESNIPTGDYIVEFKDTTGYITPDNIAGVTITNGGTTSLTQADGALYTTAYGSLSITFSPNNPTGAYWRVNGGAWQVSGATVSNIDVSANPHTIEYQSVADYSAPATENFNAVADTTTYWTRNYVPTTPTKSIGCSGTFSFGG